MAKLAIVLIVTFCTATTPAWGQSAAELQGKYSPIEVYEIRPSVWMTPSYAIDGQVCEMVLEKRHTTNEDGKQVIDEASSFSDDELQELLDELVPATERGQKKERPGYWLNTSIVGRSMSTVDTYENVLVEAVGFINDDLRTWFSKSNAASDAESAGGTDPSADHSKLVIVITWPKRRCTDSGPKNAASKEP